MNRSGCLALHVVNPNQKNVTKVVKIELVCSRFYNSHAAVPIADSCRAFYMLKIYILGMHCFLITIHQETCGN